MVCSKSYLTRRAQLVCDSPDSLQDVTDYLNNDFSKNNYNTDFVRRNTHSNTDSNSQTNSGPVTTATIPYIRGTSETIARILQPYNIRVAHKPITTLRRLLTNVLPSSRASRKILVRLAWLTKRLLCRLPDACGQKLYSERKSCYYFKTLYLKPERISTTSTCLRLFSKLKILIENYFSPSLLFSIYSKIYLSDKQS